MSIPDREAMVQAVTDAQRTWRGGSDNDFHALAVDALAPFFAAAEQRSRDRLRQVVELAEAECAEKVAAAEQRGREQQAESALTEAHRIGVEDGRRIAAQAITDRANEEDHGLTAYWLHFCARLARGEQS